MFAMATMRGVVLCLCVAVSWGGAAAQLGRSTRNLSRDLLEELTDTMSHDIVRFSEVHTNQSLYLARLDFDMRAMGPLYNISPLVIDTIAKKQAYPEGMVTVSDGHLNVKPPSQEWRTLVVYYLGPTFIILISALVIVVLPLAGLFWICWHCCRMGRRKRPFDRKYDGWMRGILSILLIVLLTAFLFGVVCAFATDSQVESGASESSDTIRMGLRDVYTFFNETIGWTRTLLIENFSELEANLAKQQQTFGLTASWKMGAFSRAASVTILYQMVQDLDTVREKLITVQALTATLRLKAEELNTGLRKVKNQLLQTLAKCDQPKCRALQEKYKIGQLDTEIQYSQMPDVSDLLHNVTELLDSGIKEEMTEGQRAFSELQRNIQRNVDLRAPSMSDMLAKLGEMLKQMALQVQGIIDEADMKLRSHEKYIDDYEKMYRDYGPYRRYAALAASCSLLLIMCLLTLGLMCGVCGKRPDVYGASDCCNKGSGSSCLLCGVGFIFLLGSLVTLVMLAHFVFGLVATRFVCDPLLEPRDNRLIADVERMVDLEYTLYKVHRDPDFNLTSVIVSCHANQTVYRTLHLWRMMRMQTLRTKLEEEVSRRSAELEASAPAVAQHITILSAGARDKLRRLADAGLSDFDFDRILSALETNMTSLALDPLAAQLNSTARSLQQPLFQAEAASLRRASAALDQLQRQVLRPMTDVADRLNVTARELRDDLRFNHTSLKEAITFLMHETSEGEAFLNDMSRRFYSGLFKYLGDEMMKQFESYLSNLESTFLDGGARCGPLSNAYNVSRDAFCAKVLLPVHGYWLSLSWCVVLLLPLLLLVPRLARLYGRPEPYPGPRADNEYLYDAYADRDNVPLANAYAAEKRAREARSGRSRSSRSGGEPSLSSAGTRDSTVAPSLDSYHARRYNDMAPKHWEEGPPRYVGSTEYERPPPYYYPGPHDRQ